MLHVSAVIRGLEEFRARLGWSVGKRIFCRGWGGRRDQILYTACENLGLGWSEETVEGLFDVGDKPFLTMKLSYGSVSSGPHLRRISFLE